MLPEVAQAISNIQGSITFDPSTQLEEKLDFHEGGTLLYSVSKFHEHLTKNEFVGTYSRFLAYV